MSVSVITDKFRLELFGRGESAKVVGFVGSSSFKAIVVYSGCVQSSRILPVNLNDAEAIVDCYKAAISEYRAIAAIED